MTSTYKTLMEVLTAGFSLVYHQDHANAAMHCATVKYSQITFRFAELIHANAYDDEYFTGDLAEEVSRVMRDKGNYEEDPGR